jgi:hypothetical protein
MVLLDYYSSCRLRPIKSYHLLCQQRERMSFPTPTLPLTIRGDLVDVRMELS